MVGIMDNDNLSEGLFLKNYLGTVSAVPRPRTVTKPYGGNEKSKTIENGMRLYERQPNDIIHLDVENEDEKEKKKEKKWTLGGLFRRKSKKDADDSSEESGEDNKKGFLRRKSKRDRRKKSRTNGFDVVIPQSAKNGEITVEQLWSGETKPQEVTNGPVRYIHRHPATLQVPKRRDSRSSGGSENTEGRKGRKEVMARAEAKRDLIRDDSSSDENDSYHSNSSLNRLNGECRRPRRLDRHKRRDEDVQDLRVIKSDFEGGRRLPQNCRWISRTYPDSSDHDVIKMNHSGTPSPCRSPRTRQKQYMMMQSSYPTSTFPPGVHYPPIGYYPKEIQPRCQGYRVNRNSEYNLPRCVSSESSNRKTLMDYEQFLNSCGSKSMSYDQNIHRASYFENDPQTTSRRPNAVIYNYTKTYNGVSENRSDSTTSGIFPHHPTQTSPNGNSFCDSYKNIQPSRSSSYQHITPKDNLKPPSILRYYADQNPRSRNPIHITCNPTTPEQPYLSDSQVVMRAAQPVRNSASDFWKLKDQELIKQQKKPVNSLKPPTERSRSNSPRLKDVKNIDKPETKILKEEYNAAKVTKTPPEPPIRRLSKQEVLARLQKCEQLKNQENELKNVTKSHSSNLDEALNELEMIYNSLRLKDEDLVDRAERRDLPVFRPKNPITSVSVRDKIQNFYAETDYPTPKNPETFANGHQRAIPLRRSGVPDKTTDDMAFRRMHQKDRTDFKKLPQQSYLRSSPALSPVQNVSPTFRKESPLLEPDITFDDVVFRNIRHANSTLKIQDPQPPFGIPIGVITPAPNSDYLHATPTERFRPTFTSSKTPDVVKDDLAFRNLRKDHKVTLEPNKTEMKKRAVRSLSANLYNIMHKDNAVPVETNNNVVFEKNCEKTQSLTDLTKGKNALEKRLKELKEEKNAKRAEFFETSQDGRKKPFGNSSWTNLANLNGDFEPKPPKVEDNSKKFRSPIVELSKYPAAAPSSSLQGNPFKETTVDDDQIENLLSELAKEAENASKDLERQLDQLESNKKATEGFDRKFIPKRRRNLSLSNATETKEEVLKTGSLERRRRKKTEVFVFDNEKTKKRTPEVAKKGERSKSESSLGGKQTFEVVTDLSQILHDVEVEHHEQHKETNNVFQEVYEYNCNPEKVVAPPANPDFETEFEKLHEEVNSTKETKDTALVDDLMADIASVDQSPGDSYTSFPFPNDGESNGALRHRDGTSPGPSNGEGIQHVNGRRTPPILTHLLDIY